MGRPKKKMVIDFDCSKIATKRVIYKKSAEFLVTEVGLVRPHILSALFKSEGFDLVGRTSLPSSIMRLRKSKDADAKPYDILFLKFLEYDVVVDDVEFTLRASDIVMNELRLIDLILERGIIDISVLNKRTSQGLRLAKFLSNFILFLVVLPVETGHSSVFYIGLPRVRQSIGEFSLNECVTISEWDLVNSLFSHFYASIDSLSRDYTVSFSGYDTVLVESNKECRFVHSTVGVYKINGIFDAVSAFHMDYDGKRYSNLINKPIEFYSMLGLELPSNLN